MNLTFSEIRYLVKIARKHPDANVEDIVNLIIEGHRFDTGIKSLLKKLKSLIYDESINVRPSPEKILEMICLYHKLSVEKVKSKSRIMELVRARQQYSLLITLFRYSQESAAEEINRDHSTIHFGKTKALYFYNLESIYKDEIDELINRFPRYKKLLSERLELLIQYPNLQQYGKATK